MDSEVKMFKNPPAKQPFRNAKVLKFTYEYFFTLCVLWDKKDHTFLSSFSSTSFCSISVLTF